MDIDCLAKRVLIFGSFFRQLSPRFETFTVTCQEHDVQGCPCRSWASYSRAMLTLPDRLPPGSWRLGSAFLLSRLPPSASAVVAPLRQRNLGTLHSITTRLQHSRSRLAFPAAMCPLRIPSSVTRAVELARPARVLQARLLLAVCSRPVQLAVQRSAWSNRPAPSSIMTWDNQ